MARFIDDQIGKSRREEDARGGSHEKSEGLRKSLIDQQGLQRPNIVAMKMDIEGSEYSVLPHLLEQRSFRHVDTMTFEFHSRYCPMQVCDGTAGNKTWSRRKCINFEKGFPGTLSTEYGIDASNLDDESYSQDESPLPK